MIIERPTELYYNSSVIFTLVIELITLKENDWMITKLSGKLFIS